MRSLMLCLALVSAPVGGAETECNLGDVETKILLVIRVEGPGFMAIGTPSKKLLSVTGEEAIEALQIIKLAVELCYEEFLADERWCTSGYRVETVTNDEGTVSVDGYCH